MNSTRTRISGECLNCGAAVVDGNDFCGVHCQNEHDAEHGRAESVGWPDLSQPSMVDELLAVLSLPRMPSKREQARNWVREAMAEFLAPG